MSKRRERIVHFMAFVALVANLFAPVLTLPVSAEDLVTPDPVVNTNNVNGEEAQEVPAGDAAGENPPAQNPPTGDDAAGENPPAQNPPAGEDAAGENPPAQNPPAGEDAAGENPPAQNPPAGDDAAGENPPAQNPPAGDDAAGENPPAEAPPVTLIAVVPVNPVVEGCGDLAITTDQTAGSGIMYSVIPNWDGSYLVQATINPESHTWGSVAAPWSVTDGVATYVVDANPCPPSVDTQSNGNAKSKIAPDTAVKQLAPVDPVIAGCGEDLTVTGAAGPAGILYVVTPNGDGSYTVTATIEPSLQGSHALNTDGTAWVPGDGTATYVVDAVPCPEMGILSGHNEKKIKICHATGNPGHYTSNTVSWQSITKNDGHWYHHDGRDIIPEFVDGEGNTWGPRPANAQQIIDNKCKVPKTGVPDVDIVDATCGPNGYVPSSLTISATGFKVLTLNPSADSASVDADGMGTYTFNNESEISVTIRIQVKDGYEYGHNTKWSYEQGSDPFIKYKSFKLKGAECDPKLSIEKVRTSAEKVNPGQDIAFKVTVTNNGDGAAESGSFSVKDTLPPALAHLNWTLPEGFGCSQSGGEITCASISVGANSSQELNFSVTAPDDGSVCGKQVNTAKLVTGSNDKTKKQSFGNQSGGNHGKIEDSDWVKINCDPGIEITKSDQDAGPVSLNETFTYEIMVTNIGNTTLSGYVVTDQLDTSLISFVSSTDGLCSEATAGSGLVTCQVASLNSAGESGNSQTFFITVQVRGDLEPEQCDTHIKNYAHVGPQTVEASAFSTQHHDDGGDSGPVEGTSNTEKTKLKKCDPKVEIEKDLLLPEDGTAEPGETITFQVTVSNNGSGDASDVSFTDTMQAPLGQLDWEADALCSEGSAGVFNCGPFDLSAGGSKVFTFTADVPLDGSVCEDGWLYNTAELDSATSQYEIKTSGNKGDDDPQTKDNAKVKIKCDPDIEVEKSDGLDGASAQPGGTITYTLTVKNTGNVQLSGYTLTDYLPDGVLLTEISKAELAEQGCEFDPIRCAVPTLEPSGSEGDTFVLSFTVEVTTSPNAEMCRGLENLADVSVAHTATTQSNTPPSDDDRISTKLNCDPGFGFEKVATDSSVEPGGTIEYTITLKNTGNIDITSAKITDTLQALPGSESWAITEVGAVDCTLTGLKLECNLTGNLVPQATVSVTISADVPEELVLTENGNEWCGKWENAAKVSGEYSTYQEPVPQFTAQGNNGVPSTFEYATESARVFVNCTGLHIEKEQSTDSLNPGDEITYTLTVTNMGNVALDDIVVSDELDDRLTYVSATDGSEPEGCSYTEATHTVLCDIGFLPGDGGTATITITATVIDQPTTEQCSEIPNIAYITGYSDAVPMVAAANREITIPQGDTIPSNEVFADINCQPDLDLEKTGSVEEDGSISFTITATNSGSGTADDLTIADTLPDGLKDLEWDITVSPDDTETVCENSEGVITCEPVFLGAYDGMLVVTLTTQTSAQDPVCGEYNNIATMGELEADAMIEVDCAPDYEVEKTSANTDDADGNEVLSVGDTITYTVTVTNTGNQPLSGITLDDQFTGLGEGGLTWTVPEEFDGVSVPEVSVGGSIDLVATYVITQDDVDAGEIENCALMTYEVDEETVIERDDCADDDIRQNPGVDMLKVGTVSGNPEVLELGNTITYTFTVTNTGNVTISDLEIDDPMEGVEFTGGNTIANLAPGTSVDLTATYEVDQSDIDEGMIVNCADVSGMAADGTEVTDEGCDTKLTNQQRDLDVFVLHECPGPAEELLAEGDFQVTYELTIVNNGTVTVHDVVMTASHEGTLNEPFPTTFDPGQSETRQWTILATEEEFESGVINVDITVVGTTENGASAMLASMAIQVLDDDVESRLVLTCPIDKPADETPKPAPEKVAKVTNLPKTGSGDIASTASVLWAAALLGVFALGASAVGVRRRQ